MAKVDREIQMRIVVIDPPEGVVFALQRGKGELISSMMASGADLSFEFTVRVGADKDELPNFLGPYVQGPRGGRFVYINSGLMAGQADSCWSRRAKIGLQGITWSLIKQMDATPAGVLEARIAGKGKDGGPACATVKLLGSGWRVATSS